MARKTFREMVDALKASSKPLRGSVKLAAALDAFEISVSERVCLDIGASTGGFTTTLIERGAARVYAVDAGHGQLLGSLRQDPRVVNLESTNVGLLTRSLVPESVDIVSIDVSYLSLRAAVEQLSDLDFAATATLVGLVKPMFELRLDHAPTDDVSLDRAIAAASDGVSRCGWNVVAAMASPVPGAKGAVEGFLHARR